MGVRCMGVGVRCMGVRCMGVGVRCMGVRCMGVRCMGVGVSQSCRHFYFAITCCRHMLFIVFLAHYRVL